MARKKTSTTTDFLDLVAAFPWWLGLAGAAVSYLLLHAVAVAPHAVSGPAQLDATLVPAALSQFALVAQFVIPALFLLGAAGSFARRLQRQSLRARANFADTLQGTSWSEFEEMVAEAFRIQGYVVEDPSRAEMDAGVDLVVLNHDGRYLVNCRKWKAYKVGVDVVRDLYKLVTARGAAGGFVVTSGSFTTEAIGFSQGRTVRLVEGTKLFSWLRQAKAKMAQKQSRAFQSAGS